MYIADPKHSASFVSDICCETPTDGLCDCNGHGTHCAGLVASEVAGYNQFTTLHSGKVFNWQGSSANSIILAAMDWAGEDWSKNFKKSPGIVSMSLGGSKSSASNNAVKALFNLGMTVIVAAGNSDKDSCTGSPSSSEYAITVGASNITDFRAYFSEYGSCVDTFAPGQQIGSTYPNDQFAYLSGTSMATPLVSGMVSYYATQMSTSDPAELKFILQCLATQDSVKDAKTKFNIIPFDDLMEFNADSAHCKDLIKKNPKLLELVERAKKIQKK
jgi:subtilisin family serine protease